MLDESVINNILFSLEKDIAVVANNFSLKFRDDIKQEIRIKTWHYIENMPDVDKRTIDEIISYAKSNLYFFALMASKAIIRQFAKQCKRNVCIDNMEFPVNDNKEMIDFFIDYKKYESILTKKEFLIVEYLFSTEDRFNNFDDISRQLGYTGKGASKYTLNEIAKKILNFNKK